MCSTHGVAARELSSWREVCLWESVWRYQLGNWVTRTFAWMNEKMGEGVASSPGK